MSIIHHLNAISRSRLHPYSILCKNVYKNLSPLTLYKCSVCTYTSLQHQASIFSSLIQEIEISVRNEMTKIIKQNNTNLIDYFCHLAIDKDTKLSPYSQNELKTCLIKLNK